MQEPVVAAAVLAVQLYLAAVLGVSGLAKLDSPVHFAAAMERCRLFPAWSINPLARVSPAVEVAVAGSLAAGTAQVVTAAAAVTLCASFLALRVVLFATKRTVNCGCHGRFYQEKIDGPSVVVSAVLFLVAVANFAAVWSGVSVAAAWRLLPLLAYSGVFLLIVSRVLKRRHIHDQHHRALALPMEAALQR